MSERNYAIRLGKFGAYIEDIHSTQSKPMTLQEIVDKLVRLDVLDKAIKEVEQDDE